MRKSVLYVITYHDGTECVTRIKPDTRETDIFKVKEIICESKKHRVFVYGTLKKGIHNHRLLEGADFIGNAFTVDTFKMFTVGFPVIRFSDNGDPVFGEVYDVDDETLVRLDGLENEGVMYDRKTINVVMESHHGHDLNPNTVIDANVSVYIGNDKYWDNRKCLEYKTLNEFGELEWHPNG